MEVDVNFLIEPDRGIIMIINVGFIVVQAATTPAAEQAHLVFANQQLVAILLPAQEGLYLQVGFGLCDREGLIFDTLDSAADWVRECFRAALPATLPCHT
jgi:hypothetical protein